MNVVLSILGIVVLIAILVVGRRYRERVRRRPPVIKLKSTPPVVVSLSSHASRHRFLHEALAGLLKLDYPDFVIELTVSSPLPESVTEIARDDPRLIITLVEVDYGPATKYLYTLDKYRDRIVVVCDDDHDYAPSWLRTLVGWYQKLGEGVCVTFTGAVKVGAFDTDDPNVTRAVLPMSGDSADGVTLYKKAIGERLRGAPVPAIFPQGYTGYLVPAGLATRLDPFQHRQECIDAIPAGQLESMGGRENDDVLMGAYLNRLDIPCVVVPSGLAQEPREHVSGVDAINTLQQEFREEHGVNMTVATYLALHDKGWL
jgi:hypothetical protein